MDIAQEFHCTALSEHGLLRREHLLIYPRPIPRNRQGYWKGVTIDDRVGLQVCRDTCGEAEGYDTHAFALSDKAYVTIGLERHPKKAKRRETHATFWGAEVDGEASYVGAPRYKFAALAMLLLVFAGAGVATIAMLEMFAGRLAYACSSGDHFLRL